ncbi:MAG: sugar phosphate isomerase/epimerase, partial [Armatimonadota bacterium]
MRLGGPLFETWSTPQQWATLVAASGYSAAFCPVGEDADEETVAAYAEAAAEADVSIAEVGAWQNNPISPDDAVRRAGIEGCCRSLELADRIGARCCVNVSGSRGEIWDGPHPENLRA